MTNTNCLEGVRCPKCGYEDSFLIRAESTVRLLDSGIEEPSNCGGYDYNDTSDCICGNGDCDHQGPWGTFQIDSQTEKGGAA